MVTITDVDFSYSKKKLLFEGLELHLQPGSITGLLGKNGAGKTSLLKLICGSLHPHSGELTVSGRKPSKREVSHLSNIFFVAEDFLVPQVDINDYIRAFSPFYPSFDHTLMQNILVEFDLRGEDKLHMASHGQKKKFLIAFALATKCRLLILDEPTNGLDIPSKSLFRKILAGSLDEDQLVIISTHQVKDISNLIDRIIILDSGKVIFKETIEGISQKVCFITGTSDEAEHAIYSEPGPGGFRLILPKESIETEVDIELLFNAITNGNQIA
jgi:ABC-2 type transport system ATP-binding protein